MRAMKISLRQMFVVHLFVAIALISALAVIGRVRKRESQVRALKQFGFTIHFDSPDVTDRKCAICGLLATVLGREGTSLVHTVRFQPGLNNQNERFPDGLQMPYESMQLSLEDAPWLDDSSIQCLSSCRELKVLNLEGTAISSDAICVLKDIKTMEALFLDNTIVDDGAIVYLSEMQSLRMLTIYDTKISKSGVDRLKSSLPECSIHFAE
jgi:hypothetical protein